MYVCRDKRIQNNLNTFLTIRDTAMRSNTEKLLTFLNWMRLSTLRQYLAYI